MEEVKSDTLHSENVEVENGPLRKLDTVHGDEAVRVLAEYEGDQIWTPEEEKLLRKKIDFRLLPVLCVTYSMLYADKVLLGQAALFGFEEDLGLTTGNRYSMTSSIFYLGFIIGAYPAIMLAQKFPIERVASAIVTIWGATLILTPTCTDYRGIYAQRFFLGVAESGISPMFMMIVGGWYKKDEQFLRMGIWYSCVGYVSIVSPLINYGIGHIKSRLAPWYFMYFVAGGITIIWGILLYFILPPDPIRAKGFNDRQRYIAVSRMRTNNTGVRNTHFKKDQAIELLMDVKFWLIFIFAFTCMFVNAPVSTFAVIIIDALGFGTLNSLLIMIPAGAYAGTVTIIITYLTYKYTGWRCYITILCELVTVTGSLILWLVPRSAVGASLFALYILTTTTASYSVGMGLLIANNAGYTKRSLASSGLYIGYCLGNFIAPLTFRSQDAPKYSLGWAVVVCMSSVAAISILLYRVICVRENRRRDESGTVEAFEHAYEDDLTDKMNKQFRYVL